MRNEDRAHLRAEIAVVEKAAAAKPKYSTFYIRDGGSDPLFKPGSHPIFRTVFPQEVPVRARAIPVFAAITFSTAATAQAPRHLNPVVDLLSQKKAVFGLYAPANRRPGRGGGAGAATADTTPVKTPAQLAKDALANQTADYLFDGTMEGNFERGYAPFVEFMKGMVDGGTLDPKTKQFHLPLFVKMHEIAPDPAVAVRNISKQLNLGVAGIVFVDVKSADEVKTGLAAMRFASKGGTRSDDVGTAPQVWGMTEKEYKEKADLWPLNPNGELVNFTIVESKEGLAKIREIAAVKGIGVLFPGAGTLRGVFTTTDAAGQRVFDEQGWEGAIQQVLAACKEFRVACGYPANATDIEKRIQQGFSVFVIGWGEQGFKAVDIGRKAVGR
jgi:2-keto-3-deoxy-L-rhamnonate aldolase RhmA